ncbi:MAG TPA: hypothetical protein VL492_12925 [Methylovirgula sp.]|nr:hypothetical protein [Methylovirgula sp.]
MKAIINRTVLTPYRVEENKPKAKYPNSIHYDVFSNEVTRFDEAIPLIISFLHTNAADLSIMAAEKHVEDRTIDLMFTIDSEEFFLRTINVELVLMRELIKYNISLEVSLYNGFASE